MDFENRPIFLGTITVPGVQIDPSGRVTIKCDRCGRRVKRGEFFHCLGCVNYDICAGCATIGVYCLNDNHSWIKRTIDDDQLFDIGGKITPDAARTLGFPTKKYPIKFHPPHSTDTPNDLFADEHRYIRHSDPREILIYTDGSCLSNGQENPQAGCAFVYRPSAYSEKGELTHGGSVGFRLETKGPTGEIYKQTSNRAELRAVIAALMFRSWSMDCNRSWRSLVIATDSEYVAINATERVERWEKAGWKSTNQHGKSAAIKNQDLWKLFLVTIRRLQEDGVNVAFWRIPREWNERADKVAKGVATLNEAANFSVVRPTGPRSVDFRPYSTGGSILRDQSH